jgi:3-phosphoshikimate 1-carboxyvinyltransferase
MRIEPVPALVGHVAVPGDKSISHRAILVAAVCEGKTVISGFGRSADTEATVAAVSALGADVAEEDVDTLRVGGVGLHGLREPDAPVDCANAGTLMRLLAGLLAGQSGRRYGLVGDASLSGRPMERVAEPLRRMGATVETTDGHAPLAIAGCPCRPRR